MLNKILDETSVVDPDMANVLLGRAANIRISQEITVVFICTQPIMNSLNILHLQSGNYMLQVNNAQTRFKFFFFCVLPALYKKWYYHMDSSRGASISSSNDLYHGCNKQLFI